MDSFFPNYDKQESLIQERKKNMFLEDLVELSLCGFSLQASGRSTVLLVMSTERKHGITELKNTIQLGGRSF